MQRPRVKAQGEVNFEPLTVSLEPRMLFLPWNMAEIKIYRLDKKISFIHNGKNLSKVNQEIKHEQSG